METKEEQNQYKELPDEALGRVVGGSLNGTSDFPLDTEGHWYRFSLDKTYIYRVRKIRSRQVDGRRSSSHSCRPRHNNRRNTEIIQIRGKTMIELKDGMTILFQGDSRTDRK